MTTRRHVLLTLLLLVNIDAADWPRWRGPANNGHAPAATPVLSSLPAEPRVRWQVPAGPGLASPVVANGVVLAFDNQDGRETLRALDAQSGGQRWRAAIDEPFSDSQGPTGPRCTPLIDGDRAYAVSCRGELQCRALKDGGLLWRVNYVTNFGATFIGEKGNTPGAARHGNNGSPLVDGDHLIACSGGPNGAGVVCLDKFTGATVWKSLNDMAGYAPPVVAELAGRRQVIVFSADGVVGLDRRDGRELWRVPVKTAFARHVATPVVVGDLVITGSHQSGLLGLRVAPEGSGFRATTVWTNQEAAPNFSSPIAVGDFVYLLGPSKNVICVEAATGTIKWSESGLFTTSADKAFGGFLVVGANILTLTDTGELILFAANPAAYRELGRTQVAGVNWCNPAFADGILYLRDGLKRDGSWRAVVLGE
ncbi:MAG TPA: PQQ-binding-like beta-propeller repeat protein [Verrucomicrobiota bacterium]|nr:PQQ-binding-like beta-propeller repeat protein [Verrucomicrobiota bacterium]